ATHPATIPKTSECSKIFEDTVECVAVRREAWSAVRTRVVCCRKESVHDTHRIAPGVDRRRGEGRAARARWNAPVSLRVGVPRAGIGMTLISRLVGRLLGLPPVRTRAVRVVRDLQIPVGDGVILLADRYYPMRHETAPLILVRTPYGRRSANVIIARL